MKKIIALILVSFLFLVCGCSVKELNHLDYDEITTTVLNSTPASANTALKGYKIYIPDGMSMLDNNDDNVILYSNGIKYYLYVDLVRYYNKTEQEIGNDATNYYQEISYNDKQGYISIKEQQGKELLEVNYNYGKIEVLTDNVKESLAKSLIILNSITYNDKVIESLIGDNTLDYSEEEFVLEGPSTGSDFLQYVEDYDNYEDTEGELPSQNKIEIEN